MCEDCGQHGADHSHSANSHEHSHDHDHSHGDGHSHGHDHAPEDHTHDHTHADAAGAGTGTVDEPLRIAVTGKGGVGKTTLSAAIARHLAAHHETIVVDADPDMNMAGTLGVEEPRPVTDQRELIEERAGGSGLVSLTPEVEDVLDSHSTDFGGDGRLLTIGAPAAANSGCMCPENSFVRSLVSSALSEDYVVMDMEAGVEHLGRGTAESVDALLIVVEPSRASIETAGRIRGLADDLGVDEVFAVVNKVRDNADAVREALEVPVATTLPYDDDVAAAGLSGESPVAASEALQTAAADVLATLGED